MKIKWYCEKCNSEFDHKQECIQHEEKCNPVVTHVCSKCGKTESYGSEDEDAWLKDEGWHKISLGRMGYGSSLDGSDVNFELCDECLCDYISTFAHKEDIYNSGSNCYYPDLKEE